MALTIGRGKTEPLLADDDAADTHVIVGDVTTGPVKQQAVTAKSTGKAVKIPNTNYTRTNFLIKQSQQYIPSRKLHVLINFRRFFLIMSVVKTAQGGVLSLISSIIGYAGITFGSLLAGLVLSFATILSLIPTFIVYCQHLHVVCWTIPWVLRQPIIANLEQDNKHLEMAITDLEGVYLTAHNRGIGVVSQKTGKIKLQVLSSKAASHIRLTRFSTITLTVLTCLYLVWALSLFGFCIGYLVIIGRD